MSEHKAPYARGDYLQKWRLERQAKAIRKQLLLTQYEVLDPWRLADLVPAHVFYLEDVVGPALVAQAQAASWDGFGFQYPDESTLLVVLNSARSPARQTATLMEELCHGLLGHRPTRLLKDPISGVLRREYNAALEHEAYDLGATLLLPKELVQREVAQGTTMDRLAEWHHCSVQLVKYRIQRCRLWKRFQQQQQIEH